MYPLHVQSYYSFLRSTISIEELVEKYKEIGAGFVPLTDLNGMYGFVKLAQKAVEAGLKPIFGTRIDDENNPENYIIFFAKNNDGYAELCKLITTKKLDKNFSLEKIIQEKWNNLILITPSINLLEKTIPKDNLYVELIATKRRKNSTRNLYQFAAQKGFKVVASQPVYFISKKDYTLQQILTAIRVKSNYDKLTYNEKTDEEYFFTEPSIFAKKWKDLPEALKSVEEIVEACNVNLEIGKYKFPVFSNSYCKTSYEYLRELVLEGLEKRYGKVTETILNRFEYEMDIISYLKFSDYFLIVWDISQEAKRRDMMMIGRGSAANSIVSYSLGFTEVDPIKHNLYFERFLNKKRSNPPDIDLDFSWKERDEIVKYVFEKYGYSRVAMISTHITFRARSAFREVAKVFGFSDGEVSKFSKFIPWANASVLSELGNYKKGAPESSNLPFNEDPWKTVINYASQLSNFPRHLSIHPSGIVITPDKITNYTALEFANNKGLGLIVTQPDMYGIEDLGLIKIDLLSQRSLAVLRDTIVNIERNANK